MPIVFHVGGGRPMDPAYKRNGLPDVPDFHGGDGNFTSVSYMAIGESPMQTLATMIFDGVLDRFPTLMIGVIEQGASWLPGWMRSMDSAAGAFIKNETRLQRLGLKPSEFVHRQVRVTPYPHEDSGWIIANSGEGICMFCVRLPAHRGWPGAAEALRRRARRRVRRSRRTVLLTQLPRPHGRVPAMTYAIRTRLPRRRQPRRRDRGVAGAVRRSDAARAVAAVRLRQGRWRDRAQGAGAGQAARRGRRLAVPRGRHRHVGQGLAGLRGVRQGRAHGRPRPARLPSPTGVQHVRPAAVRVGARPRPALRRGRRADPGDGRLLRRRRPADARRHAAAVRPGAQPRCVAGGDRPRLPDGRDPVAAACRPCRRRTRTSTRCGT